MNFHMCSIVKNLNQQLLHFKSFNLQKLKPTLENHLADRAFIIKIQSNLSCLKPGSSICEAKLYVLRFSQERHNDSLHSFKQQLNFISVLKLLAFQFLIHHDTSKAASNENFITKLMNFHMCSIVKRFKSAQLHF